MDIWHIINAVIALLALGISARSLFGNERKEEKALELKVAILEERLNAHIKIDDNFHHEIKDMLISIDKDINNERN